MNTLRLRRLAAEDLWDGRAFLRLVGAVFLLWLATLTGAAWAQDAAAMDGASRVATAPLGWTGIAHIIALPWTTIGLLVAGCLLLYHDLLTPLTWGLTGTLGVIAVGLVFAAQVTVGGAGWLGVMLILAGLAAVLFEIHVRPGYGSALAGFLLMYVGMFHALGGTHNTVFALTVSTILFLAFGVAFLAYLPKSPAWQRVGRQLHRHAALTQNTADAPHHFVGHTGRSLTTLRPAGLAEIDGLRVPVVTEGEFLEAGVPLIVTDLANGRIVVHDAATVTAAKMASIAAAPTDNTTQSVGVR